MGSETRTKLFGSLASTFDQIQQAKTAEVTAGPEPTLYADLLCTVAGLPPLPEGVTALPHRRR